MIVTHIDGRSEFLTDYKSLQRKRRVNGEYSLSFLLFKTERNEHSFPLTVEESLIEYDGQRYRIKKMNEKTIGNTPVKQIQADHTFFDLVDEYKYDTITGAKQLSVCLTHALSGTGYTFDIIDSFASVTFENYGNDNSLSLIQIALNRFGAEIYIDGKHLTFRRRIGRETDIQFRYKYNIKTLEKFVDSSNLSTYIKGFGKQNEDGSYMVTAEYTSPLVNYYGVRHAKPVYDERYTTYSGLMERLQNDLQDIPEVSITLEAVELEKTGINTEQIELGDDVFTIYEPLNIDINARIVEIVEYPEEPNSNQFTIANVQGSIVDSVADFQRTKARIDGIFEGKEKLPFNALDNAVQQSTLALKSAQTELVFENGILSIDPTNPNYLTLLNSAGFGISKNGGKTFDEAITAKGFNLSVGAIGKLSTNHLQAGTLVGFDIQSPTAAGGLIRINEGYISNVYSGSEVSMVSKMLNGRARSLLLFYDQSTNTTSEVVQAGQSLELYCDKGTITLGAHQLTTMTGSATIFGNLSVSERATLNNGLRVSGETILTGSFHVTGTKNASVPTSIGDVGVSAYETAEYYFGDIGRGEIVEGECIVEIESLFKETVNTNIDYEVFLTPYGKGLIYVDEMTPDYFVVKGDDIKFAFEIKVKRKGYETVRLELTHEIEVDDIAN